MKGVICGKGGHGVVTLNRIIGTLAAKLGLEAVSAETHGMAMRGGSVATYIKTGEYASAGIACADADFILSTDEDEARRNLPYLKKGGLIIVNTKEPFEIQGYEVLCVDADAHAVLLGKKILSGQILMGVLMSRFKDEFDIKKASEILSGNKLINMNAVMIGYKGEY